MRRFLAAVIILTLSGFLPAGLAFADQVSNNLDASVDASLESMSLSVGGSTGSVQFRILQQNGDGKNGCNITGNNQQLVVSVTANAPGVVSINPSTLTFKNCGDTFTVNIAPVGGGTATVSLNQVSNNTGGSYDLSPASFSVSVNADATAPTLHLPSNLTAEATGPTGAVVSFSATADDANPAHPVVSCTPVSGSTFALGLTTVHCSATDTAGNTAQGNFSVTVQDTTAPVISATPSNVTAEATGPTGAVVTYTNPTANDLVDGVVPISCVPASGSVFPLGSNTVSCSATDSHSNTAHSSFSILIQDTTAPVLVLPSDVTTEATGPTGAVVDFSTSANDAVSGSLPVSCVPPSGSTFALGDTQVDCSATDTAGNTAQGNFSVTVQDTTAPVISATPSNVTAEATGPTGAVVTYTNPTANDLVDGVVPVSCVPASGSVFPLGSTQVTCTAVDAHGNSAETQFEILIADTTPPEITSSSNVVEEATGPTGAVVTYTNPTANDLVDGVVPVSCVPASGSVFPLGDTHVTCTATDSHGNVASSFFEVIVRDTTAPVVTCASADGVWHNGNVSIACTATDSGSGLSSVGDSSFDLVTSVGPNTEDANAVTDSRNVCDVSGNCTTAGPVAGNKVDTKAPAVAITRPVAKNYTLHQLVSANYGCIDNGSGIASCVGTVANGANINTASLGSKNFSVVGTDVVGNSSTVSLSYTVVAYTFVGFKSPLIISRTDFKKTSTIPVKFQLLDVDGNPVSGAVAQLWVGSTPAVSSGGSNTLNYFRYDVSGGQYIFNFSTKQVNVGTNTLRVTLDDGSAHTWDIVLR